MIRVSDIMEKEIINVKNGKRMGFITDIDMDINEEYKAQFEDMWPKALAKLKEIAEMQG